MNHLSPPLYVITSESLYPNNSSSSVAATMKVNNNKETKSPPKSTPISKLNEWFQQSFGITTIKKHFHLHGDLNNWTCAFVCPITHDTFPSGQYGSHYVTDPQSGTVWHSTRKEAEHAAAARMIDSIAAAQYLIPADCERLLIVNKAASAGPYYCRGQPPLPVQIYTYISTFRMSAAAKVAKSANNNNNNSNNLEEENSDKLLLHGSLHTTTKADTTHAQQPEGHTTTTNGASNDRRSERNRERVIQHMALKALGNQNQGNPEHENIKEIFWPA
jgi:hypothetical protein